MKLEARYGLSNPSPERGGWLRAQRGVEWGRLSVMRPHPTACGGHPPPQAGEG
jgi:hypothetical protein